MTAEQINQALGLSANVLRRLDAEQVQLFTSVLAHYNGHVHESSEDRLLCLANGWRALIILFFGTFRARSVSARIYGRKYTQDPVGQFVPVAGVDDRCCRAKEVAPIQRMAGRA